MDSVAQTVTLIAAIASAIGAVTLLIRTINAAVTGKTRRERRLNSDLLKQRATSDDRAEEAQTRADIADEKRRAAQNEADRLRRLLLENGLNPGPEPEIARTEVPKRKKKP